MSIEQTKRGWARRGFVLGKRQRAGAVSPSLEKSKKCSMELLYSNNFTNTRTNTHPHAFIYLYVYIYVCMCSLTIYFIFSI